MVVVVCHDAGGAELVSSLVRRNGISVRAVLSGPAELVFARKLPNVERLSLDDALIGATHLICGTSWPHPLEFQAIDVARKIGIRSTAVIDHWVNYRRRFERGGNFHWPDEVLVCDKTAELIALRELPEVPITRIENPYRLDIIEQAQAMLPHKDHDGVSILYVTEPTSSAALSIHGNSRYFGYTEEEALRGFLAYISSWSDIYEVVIRPHPTEKIDKYQWACGYPNVRIDSSEPLLMQVEFADIVVGCNSMAMVVATWLGKRVLCAIPSGGRGFMLPHEGIEFVNAIEHLPTPMGIS